MVGLSEMSGLSENGRFVRIVQKNHAIIILRASAIRIVSFPSAGSTARIQELAALNGPGAVRFKTQRRTEQTESYNPAGVHCGHPWRGGLQNA